MKRVDITEGVPKKNSLNDHPTGSRPASPQSFKPVESSAPTIVSRAVADDILSSIGNFVCETKDLICDGLLLR